MNRNHHHVLIKLIEPVPGENRREHLYSLKQFLKTATKNLDVLFEAREIDDKGHLTLALDGEDSNVFSSLLANTFGIVPDDSEDLTDRTIKGFIEKIDLMKEELHVDIGTKHRCVAGPQSLLPIFGKGKFQNLTRLLGLDLAMPLEVSIMRITGDTAHFCLSDSQIDRYRNWTRDFLDRIMVMNCTRRQAKNVLAGTENLRNIVELERIGFYCQSIICKLGVNASKIMSDLERVLKACPLKLFSPIDIATSLDLPAKRPLTRLKVC